MHETSDFLLYNNLSIYQVLLHSYAVDVVFTLSYVMPLRTMNTDYSNV